MTKQQERELRKAVMRPSNITGAILFGAIGIVVLLAIIFGRA